jgi:hypothetical protein
MDISHSAIHYSINLSLLRLLCLHQSSGNGFQLQTFLFLCVPELSPCFSYQQWLTRTEPQQFPNQLMHSLTNQFAPLHYIHKLPGWRLSHTNFLLFSLPSQDSLLMAAGPCYIALVQIAHRTPFPAALLLLRACLLRPLPSNGRCLHSHYLATAIV